MPDLTFKQKVNLISRLANAGYDTEKSLNDLEIEEMLKIPKVTISDIHNIIELKKAVKSGRFLSYLAQKTNDKDEVSKNE